MSDVEQKNKSKNKKIRGKLQRISGDQLLFGQELLLQIALRMQSNDQTQRRLFSNHLPEIYFLKENLGCTFELITQTLNDIGMSLSRSSVRSYYSEMLPNRRQECISKTKELEEQFQSIKNTCKFTNKSDQ